MKLQLKKIHRHYNLFLVAALVVGFQQICRSADVPQKNRWEASIKAFEAEDEKQLPSKDAVLFVGSSSIRLWKLEKYFPKITAINRGFGGSQVEDSLHYAERIILPYKPKVIVLYAGDNDINAGKSPDVVFNDYLSLVKKVHRELPKTRIIFIAIKPSLKRWKLVEKMREANRLVRRECQKNDKLHYLDIDKPMLGKDGKPRPELFLDDGLHLNDKGYQLWSSILMPVLKAE